VKLIARFRSLKSGFLCLAVQSLGLSACGGQPEVVRSPAPAKVTWGQSEAPSTPDEPASARKATGKKPAPAEPSAGEPSAGEPSAEPRAAERSPAEASPAEASPVMPGDIDLDATTSTAESEPKTEDEAPEPARAAPASDPLALELQKRRTAADARTTSKAKSKPKPSSSKKSASVTPTASTYTGSDPCKATSFSLPRVRDACASGGRPAAKRVMKDAIGKATATGQSLKCSDCHANQRDYALKSEAVAELSRWLESSGS
jgi:hypothetical protein